MGTLGKYLFQGKFIKKAYFSSCSNLVLSLTDNETAALQYFASVIGYFYVPPGFVSYFYQIY